MTQVLTAAEGRALLSQQKGGKKPVFLAPTPSPAPKEPREPGEAGRSQEIVFPGKVPGLNGAGGLLRIHWRARRTLELNYLKRVLATPLRRMAGPVRLELIRYSSGQPMDYDNLVSTGKATVDALVKAQIIPDDNPQIIPERAYTQERCKPNEQRTVIRLTELTP